MPIEQYRLIVMHRVVLAVVCCGIWLAPASAQQEESPYISLDEIQNEDRYWIVSSFYRDSAIAFRWWKRLRRDKWRSRILRIQDEGYAPIFYVIYDHARPKLRALVYQIYVKDFYNRLARVVPSDQLVVQTQREYQQLKRPLSVASQDKLSKSPILKAEPNEVLMERADSVQQAVAMSANHRGADTSIHGSDRSPIRHLARDGLSQANEDLLDALKSDSHKDVDHHTPLAWEKEAEAVRARHQREAHAQLPMIADIHPSNPVAPYYIIVGSFRNLDNARRLAGLLASAEITPKIFRHPSGIYYRVAVYPSLLESQARQYLKKCREEIVEDAWLLKVE